MYTVILYTISSSTLYFPINLDHESAIVVSDRGSTNIHMRRSCLRYQLSNSNAKYENFIWLAHGKTAV